MKQWAQTVQCVLQHCNTIMWTHVSAMAPVQATGQLSIGQKFRHFPLYLRCVSDVS